MVDFTNAIEELNNYSGSEKKKTLIYNNWHPDTFKKKGS